MTLTWYRSSYSRAPSCFYDGRRGIDRSYDVSSGVDIVERSFQGLYSSGSMERGNNSRELIGAASLGLVGLFLG